VSAFARIEAAIGRTTGSPATVTSQSRRSGGSINEASVVELGDGRRYFVKTHPQAARYPGMFHAEYTALTALRDAEGIRVPAPIVAEDDFIVLEAYESGPPNPLWQEQLGRGLAALHRATTVDEPGFPIDNYIGLTPQPNDALPDWVTFWRERRLRWQLDRFAAAANADDPVLRLGYELSDRLDAIIGEPLEPCVLLHGDLWSGNADADVDGAPLIFDPASYYGRREAELGMMQMFGGFNENCFGAYAEVWPLAPESARRIAVYRLYHELNHLNLFGRTYHAQSLTTLRTLL